VRDNYNAFAKALPDTRVFYAVKANPAPEVLKLLADMGSCFDTASWPRSRWRWLPAHAGPHLLRQHDQEGSATSRAPISSAFACSRSIAPPKSRRSPAPPRREGVLPHPHRWRRRRMAAVAQVRLRAGDGVDVLDHAQALGLEAYGISFHVGSQQTREAWDRALAMAKASSATARSAASTCEDGQHGRRLPDQVPEGRASGRAVWPGDLPRAAQAFRQPHSGNDHRAGPRHGRQCRRDRRRKSS
jgi:hypothetical protein